MCLYFTNTESKDVKKTGVLHGSKTVPLQSQRNLLLENLILFFRRDQWTYVTLICETGFTLLHLEKKTPKSIDDDSSEEPTEYPIKTFPSYKQMLAGCRNESFWLVIKTHYH